MNDDGKIMMMLQDKLQTPEELVIEINEKAKKAHDRLKSDFEALPSGRANEKMLDTVEVSTPDGGKQRLKHIARVKVLDARTMRIAPFDESNKSLVGRIAESISNGPLKLSASPEMGEVVVRLSENYEERKHEFLRDAHQHRENATRIVRDIRKEYMEHAKKMSAKSEKERAKKEIEKVISKWIAEIVALHDEKAAEIDSGSVSTKKRH